MSFVLRSSSPSPPHDDDLASPLPRVNSSSQLSDHDTTTREKEKPHLEIILDSEYLTLRGTGPDVEPVRLSGHVVLNLTEATSIKEITLQFRGKARIPIPASESNSLIYIVCNHEWSFLEGDKRHSRTLKAGRHFFPFQLQIGGSLPSSIATSVFGGASVSYKLRAHAVRPGLSHNLQAVVPVHITRSFTNEALEYQQTLEIENTWPEKIMYSIMIPHKAWPAGDRLTAVVKFVPLAKGVVVLNVTSSIIETTKVYARSGSQEDSRVIGIVRHEIIGGRAIEEETERNRIGQSRSSRASSPSTTSSYLPNTGSTSQDIGRTGSPQHGSSAHANAGPSTSQDVQHDADLMNDSDIVTRLHIVVPTTATPTHGLEPIIVSHRIKWSILILNLDGHTSELRCSLPLHILDRRLFAEARAFTSATRRLILGEGSDGDAGVAREEEEDRELPSYNAHVRDRVANMFLPEAQTMRVTNPWVVTGTSPTQDTHDSIHTQSQSHPQSRPRSGYTTPLEAHLLSHLPAAPRSGESLQLDWVNSELLISLSDTPPPPLTTRRESHGSRELHTPPDQHDQAMSTTATSSRPHSRWPSRPPSPDRDLHPPPISGAHETYVHSSNASRNLNSLFKATMKPFTSFTHPLGHHHHGWLSRGSHSHSPSVSHGTATPPDQHSQGHQRITIPVPESGSALLHRAFTEVPDYSIASRGFIGGVTPLESMRGLPSYEEAEAGRTREGSNGNPDGTHLPTTQSDSNLAALSAQPVAGLHGSALTRRQSAGRAERVARPQMITGASS